MGRHWLGVFAILGACQRAPLTALPTDEGATGGEAPSGGDTRAPQRSGGGASGDEDSCEVASACAGEDDLEDGARATSPRRRDVPARDETRQAGAGLLAHALSVPDYAPR